MVVTTLGFLSAPTASLQGANMNAVSNADSSTWNNFFTARAPPFYVKAKRIVDLLYEHNSQSGCASPVQLDLQRDQRMKRPWRERFENANNNIWRAK
jgi:hypothetical protein